MPMLPKGVTNTTAVFAGDKDLHGPRVSPLFDVAVTSVAEGSSASFLCFLQSLLAEELTTDEFESIHWFGSCFYNSSGFAGHKESPQLPKPLGCQ